MKPKLFRDDATNFNNMGFGVLTHVISCEVTENLGEAPTLSLQMLDSDPLFQYVTVGNMIVCKPNKYDNQQAFVIEEITKNTTDEVSIYATHIAQHRTKLIPVSPFTASNLDGAFSSMISHSMESNPFSLVRDSGKTNVSAAMNVLNPTSFRELMGGVEGSIIDTYRGEWRYDNFTLTLYNKRGHDNGVRVMYRKNMTEFNLDENFSWEDSPTGAIGFWRKEETLVQSSIQYSAMASEFPYKKTVVVDFSDKYEDAPTVTELNAQTSQWINGKGSPSVGMEVAFNHLAFDGDKTIELGDTVHIINPNFNISTTRRIEGIVYNVLTEEYTSVTIGAQKTTLNEAIADIGGGASSNSAAKSDVTINKLSWSDKWLIADGTDFNTIKTIGTWYTTSDAATRQMANAPNGTRASAGYLEVFAPVSLATVGTVVTGNYQYIVQRWTTWSGDVFQRSLSTDGSGTWTYGAWRKTGAYQIYEWTATTSANGYINIPIKNVLPLYLMVSTPDGTRHGYYALVYANPADLWAKIHNENESIQASTELKFRLYYIAL